MTPEGDPADDIPSPEEIRATVDRMIMSDAFSRSPQLGAFLRFVVESVLQGKSDRIKGYTIGVEVLRRDVSFDPQSDPIVRVEATRLRRTIERYYAGPGVDDPVIVDLPRGSYVPTFRRRQVGGPVAGVLSGLRAWLHGTSRRGLALVAIAVVALGALGLLLLLSGRAPPVADAALTLPPGNGMPTLSVEDLAVTGTPAPGAVSAALLSEKVRDAFSRFDAINVVLDRKDVPGRHIDYRLLGSIDHLAEQTATVRFRLLDTIDDRIVWSQVFEHVSANGEIEEDKIVTALANALLQPYGVIRAHDRAKHLGSSGGDPRYRCALGTADTLRWQDRAEDERAYACLKRLTSADPSFAVGFALLAVIYYRDFLYGYDLQPDGSPPLERALRAARRAIELDPANARAYQILAGVLFARGEIEASFAAGDKALALNIYDMLSVAEYGGRLVMTGDIAHGMAMLRRGGEYGGIRPSWQHFYLFLGSYLEGDMKEAAFQAGQITSETYTFGLVAKALSAAATGDAERARQAVDRLVAVQPKWREDPRGELGRLIRKPEITNRLVTDLLAAGLAARS